MMALNRSPRSTE